MKRNEIVDKIAYLTRWWLGERKNKLREHMSDTMTVNPFLLPILFDLHAVDNFEELSELIINSHLMTGHHTGFGKLIDEKILPSVFHTIKLDADYRRKNPPFNDTCFDEIDHIVLRNSGKPDLLSLKAGKWTIQLSSAVQLNSAFGNIIKNHNNEFKDIVVGVFYGKSEALTDKYNILRGITSGKKHDVRDLKERVFVYSGREFWKWLNYDIDETQDWVLAGIMKGLKEDKCPEECRDLHEEFKKRVHENYKKYIKSDMTIDWNLLLTDING